MKHGTLSKYKAGCHCSDCTEANRVYAEHYRAFGPQSYTPVIPDSEYGAWRSKAACIGRGDISWFPSPPNRGSRASVYRREVAAAKAVCASCPVRDECLAAALATAPTHDFGIRGGLTASERRTARRARKAG